MLELSPKQQKTAWRTTSTFSPRLLETHASLGREVRSLFPDAEDVFDYNMRGWRVPRRKRITEWTGTMDPNWVRIYLAERKLGISIHLWNPCDYKGLEKDGPRLAAAGFKVMVGCMQYNRKGDVPVEALLPILKKIQSTLAAEA